ncbi:hypothetical protein [Limnobacter sp.]|uniref:hypothetical protein n=1 Tax=Limnobacter sp. TaxID=2003368 RepID=UPI0025BEBF02|nr:hypothetical protein [Limnobacter sp.]
MASTWEDDEDIYSSKGGGVYFDAQTGKYYADIGYSYKKKSKLGGDSKLGKGKTRTGDDLIELTADQLNDFYEWRQSNAGKSYRGRRGKGEYTGPGTAVGGTRRYTGPESGKAYMEAEQGEAALRKRLRGDREWWNMERASGARGMRRSEIVGARREAIKNMQQRSARQGWGRTERRTDVPT